MDSQLFLYCLLKSLFLYIFGIFVKNQVSVFAGILFWFHPVLATTDEQELLTLTKHDLPVEGLGEPCDLSETLIFLCIT